MKKVKIKTSLIEGSITKPLTALEIRKENIAAFTNGNPLPYTKEQHASAKGFDAASMRDWNNNLPEAEKHPETPNHWTFKAFALANFPDINLTQLYKLYDKLEASNWMHKGREVLDWRKVFLPEVKKLDRVEINIYNLPMHEMMTLPIGKTVTRVHEGWLYGSTSSDRSTFVKFSNQSDEHGVNNIGMLSLIEDEKMRMKKHL